MEGQNEKGIFISKKVLILEELNLSQKLVLSGIENIISNFKYCKVSNKKFAKTLNLSEKTIGGIMTFLVKKGFIKLKVIREPQEKRVLGREIYLTEKFYNLDKMPLLKKEEKKENTPLKVKESRKNGLLKNEECIDNINRYLYKKDRVNNKKNNINKKNKYNNSKSNLVNKQAEINNSGKRVELEIFDFLNKEKYSRLSRATKRNIVKNLSHISEIEFSDAYKKIEELEKQGRVRDFQGALYHHLKGAWFDIKEPKIEKIAEVQGEFSRNSEVDIEKNVKENLELEEKILWFRRAFGGVKVEEYIGYLKKISFETLKSNRKRLGRLSIPQFRTEMKFLVG